MAKAFTLWRTVGPGGAAAGSSKAPMARVLRAREKSGRRRNMAASRSALKGGRSERRPVAFCKFGPRQVNLSQDSETACSVITAALQAKMSLLSAVCRRGCSLRLASRALPALARAPALAPPRRLLCDGAPKGYTEEKVIFEGGKTKAVTTLKRLSVANLGFAVAAAPLLQYITNATGAPGKGVAMSAVLLIFGGGTTGGLTWATSTYVLRMLSIPGRDAIKIETPTFTGGIETTEVEWKDIELPVGYHMFQTFQCGKSGKKFWLDDLGEMHDETLPARLEAQLNQE